MSYNSNISEAAMKKYTYAMNELLANDKHHTLLDDVTVLYWASGGTKNEACNELFSDMLLDSDQLDQEATQSMLSGLLGEARKGTITASQLHLTDEIDENVTFYIVGIKPNATRLSLKFLYQTRFGELLSSIARHQADLQIGDTVRIIPLWQLKNELKSPNSTNEKTDPSLLTELFRAVLQNTPYPSYLLSKLLLRVKTDRRINHIRAGAIKACINRKARFYHQKEELTLSLNTSNTNQAYLCGRLFAVLQKLQENAAAPAKLNRSIKDAYFASAASKPALVFPKLLTLSQNHVKKLNEGQAVYFNKLVEEIIGKLDGAFPETLMLTDQGKFMIGYYQQDQAFYQKKDNKSEEE